MLAVNGQQMRFRPTDRPEEDADASGTDEELEDFERFAPPTGGTATAERHVDTWLQTRLHWYEADDSDELRRAPLLLLPVKLSRRSAGAAYAVNAGEDDPILNPALVEFLRSAFGIKLPELPEVTDDYDPTQLLTGIAGAVANQRRWGVTNEIVLGLFSFQKYVIFNDLEKHRDAFTAHRLIAVHSTRK